MKHPYDTDYRPPFPVIPVILHNGEEGLSTATESALLDTGSDGSMVPIIYLRQILAPAYAETRIRSHWGEWRPVQLFLVNLELGDFRLADVSVVGDEQGEEIVLGRNVLNRLRLLLDGPSRLTEILSRKE